MIFDVVGVKNWPTIDVLVWQRISMFIFATREALGNVAPTKTPITC